MEAPTAASASVAILIRHSGKRKNAGNSAPPPSAEKNLGNRNTLLRVDHRLPRGGYAGMLCDGIRAKAKNQHISRAVSMLANLHQMALSGFEQRFASGNLAPIRRIGNERLGLFAVELTPNATHQAETVTTHTLKACLMVIGCTDPMPGKPHNILSPFAHLFRTFIPKMYHRCWGRI